MRYTVIIYKDGTSDYLETKNGLAIAVSDLKTEGAEHVYIGKSKKDCQIFVDYIAREKHDGK